MAEKKETQYLLVKHFPRTDRYDFGDGKVMLPTHYDSRKVAREEAAKRNSKLGPFTAWKWVVRPIQRGARA